MGEGLTHVDEHGAARMVDVAGKPVTHRRAVASAFVRMKPETLAMIVEGRAPKGDVLAVARVAGIMAAKRTSDLIPLCHPLPLTHAAVDFEPKGSGVAITAVAETDGKTGVEMEALTAAGVAAITLYDMCKAVDRGMVVTDLMLMSKEGGKSGSWIRGKDDACE
ncbi:MAG TPA: cyclic pyranopterin monophosphate synthase MoaC [Coriobacteriia bacterium]